MPLILLVGYPCSGKSTRCDEIKQFLIKEHGKSVSVVSENDLIKASSEIKNEIYFNSHKEKEIRGVLKSDTLRLLGQENVVILDAGNYIKGYRYELYCATKGCKTTQLTIECCASKDQAWNWNLSRPQEEQYSLEAFDALIMRYEAPDSRNRWDSPLIILNPEDKFVSKDLYSALFERKPPPPNQSTQSAPLSATNFLYELDRITQEIVSSILSAKKLGLEGDDVKVPGFEGCVMSRLGPNITPAQLARYRRQFLQYTRLNPPSSNQQSVQSIALLFVQFLNTTLLGGN